MNEWKFKVINETSSLVYEWCKVTCFSVNELTHRCTLSINCVRILRLGIAEIFKNNLRIIQGFIQIQFKFNSNSIQTLLLLLLATYNRIQQHSKIQYNHKHNLITQLSIFLTM